MPFRRLMEINYVAAAAVSVASVAADVYVAARCFCGCGFVAAAAVSKENTVI